MEKTSSSLKRQRLESLNLVDNVGGKVRCIQEEKKRSSRSDEQLDREKQIIVGKVDFSQRKQHNVLLIAKEWPTFSVDYFLPNSNNHFWIHCPSCHETFVRFLPKFCKWLTRSELMKIVGTGICNWVVLQGEASFINEVLKTYLHPFLERIKILCILPAVRLRKYKILTSTIPKWKRVRHANVGGVTTSQWLIGIKILDGIPDIPNLELLVPSVGLQRRLLDIIKPTEKGIILRVENDIPNVRNLVELSGLTSQKFELPSVFSHTGWVTRQLAVKELGAVIDLPELFVMRLNDLKEESSSELSHNLLPLFEGNAPPLKIVQVAKTLLDYLESPRSECNELESPENENSNTPQSIGLIDFHHDKEGSIKNANPIVDTASRYLSLYGQKAAKDDNAPVPVELWNGYLFEKHFSKTIYEPQVHGKALEVLRNRFALRIFWRNVSTSFRKYLRATYGKLWYSFYFEHRSSLNSKKRKRKGTRLTHTQASTLQELYIKIY